MKTGFVNLDSKYRSSWDADKIAYYNAQGQMQYGQKYIDTYWYVFDINSGAMKTGFVYLDSRYHSPSDKDKVAYYDSQGRMVHSNFKQNGIQYIVNSASGRVTRQFNPTYYSQLDGRWSGRMYNDATLGATGCVSSSIAMAVNGITNNGLTPVGVADYLYYNTNEFNKMEYGASGLAIPTAAKHWNVSSNPIRSLNAYKNALSEGQIVVFLVGPGNFTAPGSTHAIVTFQNSNGSTHVYDPYNSGNNGWYSVNSIWNQKSTHPYDMRGGYIEYGLYKNI